MKTILSFFVLFFLTTISEDKLIDPVTDFENHIENHFESYETDRREGVLKLGGGWVKKRHSLRDKYSYDVQETNSLVSPYKGIYEFKLLRSYTDFHATEQEAILDNNFTKTDNNIHRHIYLYQKGNWVVTERKYMGFGGEWYHCDEINQGCWDSEQ